MGSQYCFPADVSTYGVNAIALIDIPTATLNAQCIAASAMIDDYIGGRYPLPLLSWPASFTMRAAQITAYIALKSRGYDPDAEADKQWVADYKDAIEWCKGIQRQEIHPQVQVTQPSPGNPTYDLPQVSSSEPRGYAQVSPSGRPVIS